MLTFKKFANFCTLLVVRSCPLLASGNAVLAGAASLDVAQGQSLAAFGKLDRGTYDFDGASLPGLPAAMAEAMMAVEILPNRGNRVLPGAEATEVAVERLLLQEFTVAHIAAHGLFSSNIPVRSALALPI